MTDKLQQLTQQIYEEGVAKAKEEARKIADAAQEEKKKILRSARQEAEDIIEQARHEAEALKKKTESEVRMAAQKALATLRQDITELISSNVATESSRGIFDDPAFLTKTVEFVLETWASGGCQEQDLLVRLPAEKQKDIEEYFLKKGKEQLDRGLKVEFDPVIGGGFTIGPQDGSYRIGFTDEDFQALIKHFLGPRIKQFLFGGKKEHE
ncbi:MAG: V-type ATP synthase subunit E [Candidatus Omnitrophica bacterium]|nr:V-type ATP synthase subunit E [Candidatus Omnitrophota bacterium]